MQHFRRLTGIVMNCDYAAIEITNQDYKFRINNQTAFAKFGWICMNPKSGNQGAYVMSSEKTEKIGNVTLNYSFTTAGIRKVTVMKRKTGSSKSLRMSRVLNITAKIT